MVTGTTIAGCTGTSTQQVTVNPLPATGILVSPNSTVCPGTTVTLSGTGAISYSWSGGISNGAPFLPTSTGSYTVTGTNAYGCTKTATQQVQVNALPNPAINAGGPTVFCQGGSVALTATGNIAGNAISLDGTNDYLTEAASGVDLANTSFTVEFWANRSATGNANMIFSQGGVGAANKTLHIGFRENSTFTFAFWGNDLGTSLTTGTGWHHWACTFNHVSKLRTIYRDGVQVAQDVASSSFIGSGNTNLFIGSYLGADFYFQGSLEELRIWNTDRTQSQIQNNMNLGMAYNSAGLLSYFKFDEGTGNTSTDAVTGLNAVLINGPVWQVPSTAQINYNSMLWMPWSLSGTSVTVNPSATTTFTVTAANANGCTAIGTQTITVNPLPSINSTTSPASTVCAGTCCYN